jgi:SAM-dependent methyltransferase
MSSPPQPAGSNHAEAKAFYDQAYAACSYAPTVVAERHPFYPHLANFVAAHGLERKRCLEVGSGRGAFQDQVEDYTGLDLSDSAADYYHKPFYQGSATALPFPDESFDAVWTYATLEHVPEPERALREIRRVLRNSGLLLLAPAWHTRSWFAQGYPVRPYRDFDLRGKIIKASIPVRDHLLFRSAYVIPRRVWRHIHHRIQGQPVPFRHNVLSPNYEIFWMSDSDAINSMDPFDAILWFESRGDRCLSCHTPLQKLLVRKEALEFEVKCEPNSARSCWSA